PVLASTRPGPVAADLPRGRSGAGLWGIYSAGVLRLLPKAPPVGGRLGVDLAFGLADSVLAARGRLTIDTLRYEGRRVGDIGLQVAYRTDSLTGQTGSATLTVDRRTALTAQGRYAPTDSTSALHLAADLPGLPLTLANAFLPEGSGSLQGWLRGHVEADGMLRKLRLGGSLTFDSTSIDVAAVRTRFGITDTPIVLQESRMLFQDFGLIAPNRQRLTLNGYLDLGDFTRITTDLRAKATDFQLVDVPRNRGSMVFGRASADLSARVRGALDALNIRGNIALLPETEVTYVMQDSPMGIKNESQTVVNFVVFNDTTTIREVRPPAMLQLGGIDMLMDVAIDPQVEVSVYLSEDGQNRIDLQGGGHLTYSMNRLGDTRFAGRYELSGGRVRYSPPVISTKDFTIVPGGYVGWTGDIADPTFAIQAFETVRTTVTMEDQTDRQVEFRIGIDLSGSLNALDVRFDLAAPEDLTLQNQLASLTPEQRQNQAMSLLIYNTYSGPGTSAKVNTGNPLNSFITKELNQWAQNSLPGVDLSFGIDTYDDPTAGPEGTRTDYSYKLSKKFFDNRVRVSVGGKVSSGAETTQSVAENLVGDLSLEYQLTRRDNMYLKAFRETNFESILEGEVTETGVGFGVRKRVQNLGKLFRLTPEKREAKEERRSARQEKRIEKRQQRHAEREAALQNFMDHEED
ncbi:MAG: translocation/assembly module TamB, partial [Rikenella sp.]|nr:translocation/assembly module TamB [Rikenella sp.]